MYRHSRYATTRLTLSRRDDGRWHLSRGGKGSLGSCTALDEGEGDGQPPSRAQWVFEAGKGGGTLLTAVGTLLGARTWAGGMLLSMRSTHAQTHNLSEAARPLAPLPHMFCQVHARPAAPLS